MKFISGYQDGDIVRLFYRDQNGTLMCRTAPCEYVSFYHRNDTNIDDLLGDRRVLGVTEVGDWFRVNFPNGQYDRESKKFMSFRQMHARSTGLESYEGDVSPLKRYMIENDIQIDTPRSCYLDLETDSRVSFAAAREGRTRLLSWAVVDQSGKRTAAVLKVDDDDAERELLEALWSVLERFDRIIAWNGDGFDFPVLQGRAKLLKVTPKSLRRWLWLDQLLVYKRFNTSNADDGAAKASLKLGDVAFNLLGDTKDDVDGSKTYEYWAAGGASRQMLLDYNIQDTDLCRRIEEATGYIALFDSLSQLCGVFPDSRSLLPTQFVDMFLLRLGHQNNVHFRSNFYEDEKTAEKFDGGYVLKPKCNIIFKNVEVCDMASLYPSMIRTFHLSPDCKIDEELVDHVPAENICTSPSTGLKMRNDVTGMFCLALEKLMGMRKQFKKQRAAAKSGSPEAILAERYSNAAKTAINSFYGCIGTIYSRFYDKHISESITQNGVFIIKSIIAQAEARGWQVVASDTDSAMVVGPTTEEFSQFVKWCNTTLFPRIAKDANCNPKSVCLELAHEKGFAKAVFIAKKRYVAVRSHYGGRTEDPTNPPVVVTGLEVKRADTNSIGRAMQKQIIEIFRTGGERPQDYLDLVKQYRKRVLEEPMALEDVVLSKSISKPLDQYASRAGTDPSHVAIAKKQEANGEDVSVGTRVRYVITDAKTSPMTAIPADQYNDNADRHYIWECKTFPPSYRLLKAMFPKYDWEFFEKSRPTRRYNPNQLHMFPPN